MANLCKLTRVNMLVKRNPSLNAQEFQRQWSGIWGPLSAPFLKRISFTAYFQLLLPSTSIELGGPQFDAFAKFLAPDFEAFLVIWNHLFYNERLVCGNGMGEELLIDPDKTMIMNAGVEEVYLFGG